MDRIWRLVSCCMIFVMVMGLSSCREKEYVTDDHKTKRDITEETDKESDVMEVDDKEGDVIEINEETLEMYIENQGVVLEENDAQIETLANYSLGNASIILNEDKVASIAYSPLGGATYLELMDSGGNLWRLDIPENALPYSETISMKLSEDITSDVVSGTINSGVVFEPEGLQFTLPATLTVTGSAVDEYSCVFYGNHSGENLNFAPLVSEADSVQVYVEHFSSYIVYTPSSETQIQELANLAKENYNEILEAVKAFLKTPISAPPLPPDYTFRCSDKPEKDGSKTRNRALDMYVTRVLLPESDFAKKLLGAGSEDAFMGGENEGIYYAGLLLKRNLKKVDELISSYSQDLDKLVPVMTAAFRVLREMSLMGVDPPESLYLEIFSEWMGRAADEQIRIIKEDHNYKALGAAISLAHGAAILESDFSASSEFRDKYWEDIKDAMTFTVTFEATVFCDMLVDHNVTLSGKVELPFVDETGASFTNTGEGEYLSYTASQEWGSTLKLPNVYPVNVKLMDFSPCDSEKVKVLVDTIGAQADIWYNEALDEYYTDEGSIVNEVAESLFKEYMSDGDGYVFELWFHNGSQFMASEGFVKTDTVNIVDYGSASCSINYIIEIEHTPK